MVLVPIILNFYLLFYTLIKSPRNTLTDIFIFFLLVLISWQFYDLLIRLIPSKETVMFLDRIFCHGWIMSAAIGLHFAMKFYQKPTEKVSLGIYILVYLPALIFMALYPVYTLPSNYKELYNWGWFNVMENSPFHSILLLWFFTFAGLTFTMLFLRLIKSKRGTPQYNQSLMMCIGYLIPAIQGTITQIIFPVFLKTDPVPVTSTTFCIFSITALVALNRYQLFFLKESISASSLMESISDIIIAVDLNNEISYVNNNGEQLLGYSKNELNGKQITSVLKLDNEPGGGILDTAFEGKRIESTDCFMVRRDQTQFPVSMISDGIFIDGKKQGVLLIARDISEFQANLLEKNRQSAFFQQLFDASPLAMTMLNLDGTVIRINKAFEETFQYAEAELSGKRLSGFLMPEELKEESGSKWETRERPRSIKFESQRKKKNGDLIDVFVVNYIIDVDGKMSGVYSIYEDISFRKNSEILLQRQNEELIKVNKELDKFVYSVSYDIRAPLMSIKGIVNMAEEEIDVRESYQNNLSLIRTNIERLDNFTSNIIRYYKDTREEVSPEPIDFKRMIEEVFEFLRYHENAQNIQFILNVQQSYKFVSDQSKLQVILNNLISNSIKYREERAGENSYIKIDVSVADNVARIRIEDNGEGIRADKLENIFAMFSRYSTRSIGSGLGLYIVYEVINKLNGHIEVASEYGKGSVFTLIIPGQA